MHRNTLAFVIVAAIGGFVAGFWLANSINRTAVSTTTPPSANSSVAELRSETDLTDAEIRAKIAEADQSPDNLAFQRDLGISLYRYGAMKQDAALLGDAIRILERANSLKAGDFDILVALGNAHFDVGFFRKDALSFQRSREVYSKALALKPGEPDVSTDLGLTYFLQDPPENEKAASELEKVVKVKPDHDRALQFLVQVYLKLNRIPDAEAAFTKLKTVNSKNPAIAELTSKIVAAGGTAK